MEKSGKPESHGSHDSPHHITPLNVYGRVFGSLICLTIITVATSYCDFGSLNILIAMAIATIKALLVILFFMGLKYEGQENNVTFFCSFVFLAIFVGLTSSDLLYRSTPEPVKPDASELTMSGPPADVQKLVKPTPELVAKGKALFTQNCVTCHGGEGKGDGPAAAALTPKPRNFTATEGWKFGRTVSGIFKTVTNGSPGTPMPPFAGLSAEDRFAVAHYVRTFMSSAPEDTGADVAALTKEVGTPPKPHLSVERAMEKVAEEWAAGHPAGK
ncbi:MAG: cytochrome C oxidase subunit IV family protein [Deltaproteobacteria bacterium]|nr:cytochrome C oxidase subunit IV family protein [Deltaproteobacteria bacterium]